MNLNNQMMSQLMNQFGGPQQFQQRLNAAQQQLQQMNMSPEQFLNQQVQNGQLSQDRLNWAIEQANQAYGRK